MHRLLRFVVILLLLIAWWDPLLPVGKAAIDFIVILDDSISMERKIKKPMWEQVGQFVGRQANGSRLAVIRYANDAVLELPPSDIESETVHSIIKASEPPHEKPLDRTASNPEEALRLAARLVDAERQSVILLVNDGRQTSGYAAEILPTLNIQTPHIYNLRLSAVDDADSWIAHMDSPLLLSAHEKIPVSVSLGSNRNTETRLSLYVNDQTVMRRPVSLLANSDTSLQFLVDNCGTDFCQIRAVLETEHDAVPRNNVRHTISSVSTIKPLLYIRHTEEHSALAETLRNLGHEIIVIAPALCSPSPNQLGRFRSIILDDIAINEMPGGCWSAIADAVRNNATGLIVLGGNHSFSAGLYRHSLLESLLPVTAEANRPTQSASIVFAIDKSGSMDHDDHGTSPIKMAKQAILETVRAQTGQDKIGLISFDIEPHLILPVQVYPDPGTVINDAFVAHAQGGTRIAPALSLAMDELGKTPSDNRILVLITDGFLDQHDLRQAEHKIAAENITLIALAIGRDIQLSGLRRLTEIGRGKLLQVDNSAELPLLMRRELEQTRTSNESGEIKVHSARPLPFLNDKVRWPRLLGYTVTKAKQDSTVFLHSDKGDPLLIRGFAGTGDVIVLPAGLGHWAAPWISWEHWNSLVEGLISWSTVADSELSVKIDMQRGDRWLEVNAIKPDRTWEDSLTATLTIADPHDRLTSFTLLATAPGHYFTKLPMSTEGPHRLRLRLNSQERWFGFYNESQENFNISGVNNGNTAIDSWIKPVGESTLLSSLNQIETANNKSVREMLIILSLIFYLILIIIEKNLVFSLRFNIERLNDFR